MSEERWVVVSDGTPNTRLVGKTSLDDDALASVLNRRSMMVLREVRAILTVAIPTAKGILYQSQMTALDFFKGAAPAVRLVPQMLYFMADDPSAMKEFETQLESIQLEERASAAGLHTPKSS